MSALVELLHELARVIEARGLRWYVFGAQAVVVHGRPRMTADVDISLYLPEGQVRRFIDDMARAGFSLRVQDVDDFVEKTRVLPFLYNSTQMPLDIVLAGPGIEEIFADGARPEDLGGVAVPVISPEHLVVTKILAGRSKDLDDVEGVCTEKGDTLDVGEIRRLLADIEQALAQSDLLPAFERILAAVGRARGSQVS